MPREANSTQALLPTLIVDSAWIEEGAVSIITLLREAKFSKSNSEARRLISQGGVKWDGQVVDDIAATIASDSLSADATSCVRGRNGLFVSFLPRIFLVVALALVFGGVNGVPQALAESTGYRSGERFIEHPPIEVPTFSKRR